MVNARRARVPRWQSHRRTRSPPRFFLFLLIAKILRFRAAIFEKLFFLQNFFCFAKLNFGKYFALAGKFCASGRAPPRG